MGPAGRSLTRLDCQCFRLAQPTEKSQLYGSSPKQTNNRVLYRSSPASVHTSQRLTGLGNFDIRTKYRSISHRGEVSKRAVPFCGSNPIGGYRKLSLLASNCLCRLIFSSPMFFYPFFFFNFCFFDRHTRVAGGAEDGRLINKDFQTNHIINAVDAESIEKWK